MIINLTSARQTEVQSVLSNWPKEQSELPSAIRDYHNYIYRYGPHYELLYKSAEVGNTPKYEASYPTGTTQTYGVVMYTDTACRAFMGVPDRITEGGALVSGYSKELNIPADTYVFFTWARSTTSTSSTTSRRKYMGIFTSKGAGNSSLFQNITGDNIVCYLDNGVE